MTRGMTSEQALAIAAGKLKDDMAGKPFRWSPKRDRELQQLHDDLFSSADCAKILGSGCTPAQVEARLAELKAGVAGAPAQAKGSGAGGAPPAGVRAEEDPLPPRPRPEKLQLPRYGEMEKRFDRFVRGDVA